MTVTNQKSFKNALINKQFIGIIILFSAICALNIPILVTLWRHGFDDGTYSHAFLIPFISLYLYYELVQSGKLQFRDKISIAPTILLGLSCYLLFITSNAQISIGYWIALLAIFITSVIMLYRFNWYIVFPAAFLIFIFPFWGSLTSILQTISVSAVTFFMSFTTIPTYVEAQFVHIPSGTFEIAHGCSGLRYLIVSIAISSLFIFLNIKSPKRAIIFFSFALFGGLLTNWLRITILVLIGDYTDMTHSLMNDHNSFGWYVYLPFMLLLFYFGNKISDHTLSENTEQIDKNKYYPSANKRISLLCIFAIFTSSTSLYLFAPEKMIQGVFLPEVLPEVHPEIHNPSHFSAIQQNNITTLHYYFDSSDLDSKPTYYENSLIPRNWQIISSSNDGKEYQAIVFQDSNKAIIKAYYQFNNYITGNVNEFKIHRLKQSYRGKQDVELIWTLKMCNSHCE